MSKNLEVLEQRPNFDVFTFTTLPRMISEKVVTENVKKQYFGNWGYLDQELAGPGVREEGSVDEPAADGDDQRQDDGDGGDAEVVVLACNKHNIG